MAIYTYYQDRENGTPSSPVLLVSANQEAERLTISHIVFWLEDKPLRLVGWEEEANDKMIYTGNEKEMPVEIVYDDDGGISITPRKEE